MCFFFFHIVPPIFLGSGDVIFGDAPLHPSGGHIARALFARFLHIPNQALVIDRADSAGYLTGFLLGLAFRDTLIEPPAQPP